MSLLLAECSEILVPSQRRPPSFGPSPPPPAMALLAFLLPGGGSSPAMPRGMRLQREKQLAAQYLPTSSQMFPPPCPLEMPLLSFRPPPAINRVRGFAQTNSTLPRSTASMPSAGTFRHCWTSWHARIGLLFPVKTLFTRHTCAK